MKHLTKQSYFINITRLHRFLKKKPNININETHSYRFLCRLKINETKPT